MSRLIYLDNNATTPLDPDVARVMFETARAEPGNPGSRHAAGRRARQLLEDARETVARILDAQPDEVLFTSGGTESSNLAIRGLTEGRRGAVLLPAGEHPSVDEPVRRLIREGWKRSTLPISRSGRLDLSDLPSLDRAEVKLACALLAHNETGVIQDLAPLVNWCRDQRVPLHVDAVQAAGKIDLSFRSLGATTMSVAAHKFHGPVGIGALLVKSGSRLQPQSLGGHQERSLRAGTEAVLLATGMAHALRIWHERRIEITSHLAALRDRLQDGLLRTCPPVVVNGDPEHRLPNTLHVSFPGCDADPLLVGLDLAGVCCSLGSACASGSAEPAPILLAMGLEPELYKSALRLSVGRQNTFEEIDEAVERIAAVVRGLRGGK